MVFEHAPSASAVIPPGPSWADPDDARIIYRPAHKPWRDVFTDHRVMFDPRFDRGLKRRQFYDFEFELGDIAAADLPLPLPRIPRLRVGSLFAGIGGFDLGFQRAGLEISWQAEIDDHCRKLLMKKWPGVPLYGDVEQLKGADLATVDVLCGGFPCQDISVAGHREGLAGDKSRLFWQFLRVADECAARWVVIENVGGLLSSNGGEDLAAILEGLTAFRPIVPQKGWQKSGICWGPRRVAVWRLLDVQYFGVPQKRTRVVIVGCSGAERERAVEVLFEPESCEGRPKTVEATAARVAATLTGGSGRSRGVRPAGRRTEDDANLVIERPATDLAPALRGTWRGADDPDRRTFVISAESSTKQNPATISAHESDTAAAITSSEYKRTDRGTVVTLPQSVRRLVPLELERLQGFPDGWTDGFSDMRRTMMVGNAMPVPMAEWVGRQLRRAEGR